MLSCNANFERDLLLKASSAPGAPFLSGWSANASCATKFGLVSSWSLIETWTPESAPCGRPT